MSTLQEADDRRWMRRALALARRGQGAVEPNPMVGCVLVRDGRLLAEGYHAHFGGPHAERAALATLSHRAETARATWYVTLEPCCHQGKTPPCTDAVIASEPARVVVAQPDPFPAVAGGGLRQLEQAGIAVTLGVEREAAERLNAPYLKRLRTGRPWVIAKWAMTLDGKIATATGHSQWISSPQSRRLVHQIRGRVDAILVGSGTALADDPLLTARPPGARTPTRVVLDRRGRLPATSRLANSLAEGPVLVFTSEAVEGSVAHPLGGTGCEVLRLPGAAPEFLDRVLEVLGQRGATNVLVEGGAELLGGFLDADAVDEYHVFVAPRIVGGRTAPSPIGGVGKTRIDEGPALEPLASRLIGGDVYLTTRRKPPASSDPA